MPSITIQPEKYIRNNSSKFIFNIGVFFSLTVILLLIYYPAIRINYFFMEDYVFVKVNSAQYYEPSLISEVVERTRDGKSIYGIFLYVIANYFEDANSVRLLGVIGLGLLAYVIYKILKMYQIKTEHAFLISVLVCTLPSFQILITWTVAVPYIYSAILSVIAGLLFFKIVLEKNKGSSIFPASFFFIIVLLVIAMHIYPPTAMLYWAVGIIPLSVLKDEDFTKKWYAPFIIYVFVGFISLAAYFFSVKILHFLLNTGFPSRGGFIALADIPLKLKWFFCCPLNYALNLWNIFPTSKLANIVGIIIIGLFISKTLQVLRKEKRINLLWNHCQRLFLITGILLLSFIPNLLVTDTVVAYRTLVSLAMAICFLSYFGFVNIVDFLKLLPGFSADLKDKAVTISLIIIALIATYHAHNNVNNFAMLQANEYKYMKSAISEYGISNVSKISEIYVRRTDENKIIEKGFLNIDEFSTTAHPWGPPNVIRRVLRELGINANIKITQGTFDEPIPKGENVLAIDMTKFDYVSNYNSSITKSQRYCLTIPDRL